MYVAAQVARMDLKVDSAVRETMRVYKNTIKSTPALGLIPLASSSNRVAVAVAVCKALVNSFSGPSINVTTVQQIVKNVIWDDVEHNFNNLLAGTFAITWPLGTMIINVALIVPSNIRLLLMLACDVTLVLTRAFKECTRRCTGQPLKRDIEKAAYDYRTISRQVHDEVKELIPMHNVYRSFQAERIKNGFRQILDTYLKLFVDGAGTWTSANVPDKESLRSESSSVQPPKKLGSS